MNIVPKKPSSTNSAEPPEDQAQQLWSGLQSCTNMIENKLRQHLRLEFGCTLPRFELMAQLDSHPQGLSMGELSQLMMVSAGNVTGIATQLEKDHLVLRRVSKADRRSYYLSLTEKGKTLIDRMLASHREFLTKIFQQTGDNSPDAAIKLLGQLQQQIQIGQARVRLSSVPLTGL